MKTLEELKQEMDSALAAYATADDAEDSTWSAWDDAARDAATARTTWRNVRDAYKKRLKELDDEDT